MVKVVVGMMGSSVAKGSSSMATAEQVNSFLDIVQAHGVQEIDTARVYNSGKSEELLGAVHAHERFAVSTKAPGFVPGVLEEAKIFDNCRKSLEALKQDKMDIYYIHGPDRQTPLEEQCRAMATLYKQGKFERFGVSNLSSAEVEKIYDICQREGYVLPSVYQGGYNPLGRAAEKSLLKVLRKLNMNFYAYSPLAGGLLAKPIDDIIKPLKGSRFDEMPVFGTLYLKEPIINSLQEFTSLCDKNATSVMEATLRWFVHHSPLEKDDGFILGASTNQQIEKSLSAAEKGPLPKELVQGFDDMWSIIEIEAPPPSF